MKKIKKEGQNTVSTLHVVFSKWDKQLARAWQWWKDLILYMGPSVDADVDVDVITKAWTKKEQMIYNYIRDLLYIHKNTPNNFRRGSNLILKCVVKI